MTRARPLRFLALLVGGWVCLRAAILVPAWQVAPVPVAAAAPRQAPETESGPAPSPVRPILPFAEPRTRPISIALAIPAAAPAASPAATRWIAPSAHPVAAMVAQPTIGPIAFPAPLPARRESRWSGSAWLLLRDGRGGDALAPGGTLGGSQAGVRLLYRLGDGLALSGRAYIPLRRARGAEAAVGLDWRPSPRLPLHLLAERRQDLGGEGRSAFALTLYGGVETRLPGGLRGEAYGQAGMVGTRSRDLFADGAARVTVAVGPVEAGGGAWAAAQPGAARLDAGPSLSWRLPVRGANLRLQADWRLRIAGDATPGSGPALTLAADF